MRRVIGMVTAVAVLATGCTDGAPGDAGASRGEREPAGTSEQPLGIGGGSVELPEDLLLVSFDACADYHDYITARALELVGPYGLDGGGGHWFEDVAVDEVDDGDAEMAVEDSAGAPAADEISGTNVQEVGVDEPDIVKTDGATMYVVAQGLLRVLDIRGDEPRELATLELAEAWDARLLLDGDHLLVTSSSPIGIPFAGERITSSDWGWGWGTTTIVRVDVSDPSAPRVAERLTIDGSTVSSRLVDGVARVVVRTEQGNLPWVYPEGSGLRAERRATEANRELIRNSEPEDWIPYFVHRTADGQEREGPALACDRIARPSVFSGLGVLSVLTIDLDGGGLIPGDEAVGVLTGGDTVYASPERLYVGTTSWVDWDAMGDRERQRRGRELTTAIHAFDTSDPGRTDYLASGEVPGTLLSQWAMSEHEGRLRVASTAGDPWGWGRQRRVGLLGRVAPVPYGARDLPDPTYPRPGDHAMRFLHTSDWQLGMTRHYLDDEAQARFAEARLDAIARMAELATDRGCAFAVVAGDVFETAQPDAMTVARALERLARFTVPVYLLPGNHDPYDAASIYRNPAFLDRCPDHVQVLPDTTPRTPCQGVQVVGAPWTSKRPLSDLVGEVCAAAPADGKLRVVVGHGAVTQVSGAFDDPSTVSLEAVERAIADARVHYVALGDRHSCTSVGDTGRVWFSGAPEPTSYREVDAGTALVVDLNHDGVEVERVAVGTWTFHEVAHTVDGDADLDALLSSLDAIDDPSRAIVKVKLTGVLDLHQAARLDAALDERALRFGAIERPVRDQDLVIRPSDGDLSALPLTGYAADARDALQRRVAAGGEDGEVATDALALLLRLAGDRVNGDRGGT
jgi:DNA repair exonuclease SbcCD nuclease subunit